MVPPSCNVAVGHYLDGLLEFTLSSITSLASTASCSSLVSLAYQPSFYQSFTCSSSASITASSPLPRRKGMPSQG